MANVDTILTSLLEQVAKDLADVKHTSSSIKEDVIIIKEKVSTHSKDLTTHNQLLLGENRDNGLMMDVRDLKKIEEKRQANKKWLIGFGTVFSGKLLWDAWTTFKDFLTGQS